MVVFLEISWANNYPKSKSHSIYGPWVSYPGECEWSINFFHVYPCRLGDITCECT